MVSGQARGSLRPFDKPNPAAHVVALGLLSLYLIGGSTYLAIAVGLQTLPPLLSAGGRFLLAGGLLLLILGASGHLRRLALTVNEARASMILGVSMFAAGNGFLVLAQQHLTSGLAALFIGSVPLWVLMYRRLVGENVPRRATASAVLGLVGVALLLGRSVAGSASPLGLLFVTFAAASWAWGLFMSRRLSVPRNPFVSVAMQMICAGLVLALAGVILGEASVGIPQNVSTSSVVAMLYLVIFGSLINLSVLTWLLQNVSVSTVATYAYVNPVVAIVLGSLVLDEAITPPIVLGATLILGSVAMVIREARVPDSS
jgi:drug/metabolite transporter (DMT)-like permease